jgi:hypothetical protein
LRTLVLAASLALTACGGEPPRAGGCAREAQHQFTWSNPSAPDTVTARAEGPTCRQAMVTLAIRDARGNPLWAFAAPYHILKAGDGPLDETFAAVDEAEMDAFLSRWADLSVQNTGELPQWREGEARLSGETFAYYTELEREAYEMLRGRDLAMACFAAAAESTTCLIVDPLSRAPAMMVAYGP